jgi:anti-sigma factor RsiW
MSAGRGVPHNDALLDELVAYLDGELDRDANRHVERRLSQDAGYRDRLRRLQQTWDLLDHLPPADVDESFTQSTIAMVAVRAANEHRDVASRGRRQRHLWFAGIALGTALTFAFGFAATRWVARSAAGARSAGDRKRGYLPLRGEHRVPPHAGKRGLVCRRGRR